MRHDARTVRAEGDGLACILDNLIYRKFASILLKESSIRPHYAVYVRVIHANSLSSPEDRLSAAFYQKPTPACTRGVAGSASTRPVVIKKSDIASRAQSKTSIMPKGLLDKLTREEILDLIAYVVAKGDPKSPLFQGGGHEGHGQ